MSAGFKEYLIGECKFKNAPFGYGEYLDVAAKLARERESAAFHYALFSRSGFDAKLTAEAERDPRIALYSQENIVGGVEGTV